MLAIIDNFSCQQKSYIVTKCHEVTCKMNKHAKICTRMQKYEHARENMYTHAKICTRTQKYAHARKNMYTQKTSIRKK